MMRAKDSLLLSYAKLRTRKIRLIVTIIISSLLFAVLVFIALVSTGIINSLKGFGAEGYGGRYLVQAVPLNRDSGPDSYAVAVDKLKPVNDDIIKQKKALAKKLNLPYDEINDQTLPLLSFKGGNQNQYFPNYSSRIALELMAKENASIPGTSYEEFRATAHSAGATQTFRGSNGNSMFGNNQSSIQVLTDGKEDLSQADNGQKQDGDQAMKGAQSILTMGWRSLDSGLLIPFTLPGQSLTTGKDGTIPVIAPMSAAEEVLGVKPLPQTATAAEKLERLDFVRKNIAGKTAQLCYRNTISSGLLGQALQQNKEIEANKNKKDYVAPSLIYAVPTEACAQIAIKSDKRTAEEKKLAENQKQFDSQFGQETEQQQGIITVRMIGITPDLNMSAGLSASVILSSLLSSSLGNGWISPSESIKDNALIKAIQTGGSSYDRGTYYAEFKDLKSMKRFIEDQACEANSPINTPSGSSGSSTNFVESCIKQQRVLVVSAYGNSAGAVDDFRQGIWKVARFVILGVVVIATLIMMGNVGKIIADSRRETAVFRALGASRLDMSQVYFGYTVLLSLQVALCAYILGAAGAYFVHQKYHADISTTAVLSYNASDIHKQFNLFGVDIRLLLGILGLVVLTGLISATIPLLTNMRRNPIRDMRNDN